MQLKRKPLAAAVRTLLTILGGERHQTGGAGRCSRVVDAALYDHRVDALSRPARHEKSDPRDTFIDGGRSASESGSAGDAFLTGSVTDERRSDKQAMRIDVTRAAPVSEVLYCRRRAFHMNIGAVTVHFAAPALCDLRDTRSAALLVDEHMAETVRR